MSRVRENRTPDSMGELEKEPLRQPIMATFGKPRGLSPASPTAAASPAPYPIADAVKRIGIAVWTRSAAGCRTRRWAIVAPRHVYLVHAKQKRPFDVEIEAKVTVYAFDEDSARKKVAKAFASGRSIGIDVDAGDGVWTYTVKPSNE